MSNDRCMRWHLALAIVVFVFSGCSQNAANPVQEVVRSAEKMVQLETDVFRLSMPSDWTIATLKPAVMTGPGGEYVQISSFTIQGSGNQAEGEGILQEVVQNSREAMRRAAADPQLRITKDLTESRTQSRQNLIEMDCETTDGLTLFSQFAIAGPRTVVLATIEVEKDHSQSIGVLRKAVENIEWINQE